MDKIVESFRDNLLRRIMDGEFNTINEIKKYTDGFVQALITTHGFNIVLQSQIYDISFELQEYSCLPEYNEDKKENQ